MVIDRIAPLATEAIESGAELVDRWTSRGYVALSYRPHRPAGPYRSGFERGIYDRGARRFTLATTTLELETVWGLPEFDTPGHSTGLAARQLVEAGGRTFLFVDPGQGLLPALVARSRPGSTVVLRSRDLLALAASARGVGDRAEVVVQPTLDVAVDPALGIDVAVYRIADDEPPEATLAALRPLIELPSVIVHGSSTRVARVAQALRLEHHERLRHRGSASLWYRGSGPRPGGRRGQPSRRRAGRRRR